MEENQESSASPLRLSTDRLSHDHEDHFNLKEGITVSLFFMIYNKHCDQNKPLVNNCGGTKRKEGGGAVLTEAPW